MRKTLLQACLLGIIALITIDPVAAQTSTLWLRADSDVYSDTGTTPAVDGDNVRYWVGQTTAANIANATTVAIRPDFVENALNFNPAVNFGDGTPEALLFDIGGPVDLPNGGAYTIFAVGENESNSGFRTLFEQIPQGEHPLLTQNGFLGIWNGSSAVTSSVSLNTEPHLLRQHSLSTSSQSFTTNGGAQTGSIGESLDVNLYYIGNNDTQGGQAWGNLSEVLLYDSALNATQIQQVESYLAVKYGMTLHQSPAQSYLNSSGAEIYDADGIFDAYDENIVGLGEDSGFSLDQKVTKSINNGSILTLATILDFTSPNRSGSRTSLGDGNFLITGHDGAGSSFGSIFDGLANSRMDQIWAVDETGSVGPIYVAIPNTTSFPPGTPSVVISSDTTFNSSDTVIALTDDGTHYWALIDPADAEFFTFASDNSPPPGNCTVSGTSLVTQTGNAVSQTSSGGTENPVQVVGALQAAGIGAGPTNSARLLGGDVLTLDITGGDLLPASGSLEISLARDNNSGNVLIETSVDGLGFDSVGTFGGPSNPGTIGDGAANDVLERLIITIGVNGARYVRFTRQFGRYWIDGVEYDEICLPLQDYSDAPPSFTSAFVNIDADYFLGSTAPDEDSGNAVDGIDDSGNAQDDDTNDAYPIGFTTGIDEEDGATFNPLETTATSYTVPVSVTNNGVSDTYITGWIDFDRDDVFSASDEVSNQVTVAAGSGTTSINLTFTVPADIMAGPTFARIILSTVSGLSFDGGSGFGEVEDTSVNVSETDLCSAGGSGFVGFDFTNFTPGGLSISPKTYPNAAVATDGTPVDAIISVTPVTGGLTTLGNGKSVSAVFEEDDAGIYIAGSGGALSEVQIEFFIAGTTTPVSISGGFATGDIDDRSGIIESLLIDPSVFTATAVNNPTTIIQSQAGSNIRYQGGASHNAEPESYVYYAFANKSTLSFRVENLPNPSAPVAGGGYTIDGNETQLKFSNPDCVILVDYSDAPGSYGTAQHTLLSGYYMGLGNPDVDFTSLTSTNADGDDLDGTDDEDGVTLPALAQGQPVPISVSATGAGGYLQAWMDWDGNGTFDVSEQIALDLQDDGTGDDTTAADGIIEFNITVPFTAVTTQTFARFRWSTNASLNATTAATDGEVEDYAMIIAPTEVALGEVSLEYIALDNFSIATLRAILSGFEEIAEIGELTEDQLRQRVSTFLDLDGDGLVGEFRWETLSQRGTLGFYVERQQSNGTWQRLQSELQPAMIPAPYGAEYRNWDPSAIKGRMLIYRLIEQETNGQLKTYGPFLLR